MVYVFVILLCVALDQALKLWTVANLGLYEAAPLLPGIVELRYIQNTGGGFSILTGHTWLLVAATSVVMLALAFVLYKKYFPHPLGMWTLALILGGGVGNLIDRVRLGYVVDMFNLQFMNYPVFNIADIFVVCGTIGFVIYYLLLHDKVMAKLQAEKSTEEALNDGNDEPAGEQ